MGVQDAYKLQNKFFFYLITFVFVYSIFVMIDKKSIEGFIYIFSCFMFFVLGYMPYKKLAYKKQAFTYSFKKYSLFFLYLLLFAGTCINIYAATFNTESFNEFVIQLITSTNEEVNLRESYELSSEQGGISGLLKILGGLNLAVTYIFYFIWINDRSAKNRKHFLIAILFLAIRLLFTLEFTTAFVISYLLVSYSILSNKKRILIILITLIFASLDIVAYNRIGKSFLYLLDSYFTLGFDNFIILIESYKNYNFGISTILNPLAFVFQYLDIPIAYSSYEWKINPAQNLFGDTFLNFRYLGVIEFFFYGIIIKTLKNSLIRNVSYSHFSPYIMVFAITILVVPNFKGIDFWFLFISSVIFKKIFIEKTNNIR